jgi:hypothetical protein
MQWLAALLLVLFTNVAFAQNSPSNAEKRLKTTEVFAFGGTGIVGKTSQGETDFQIILSQPKAVALEIFERVYVAGNAQARSYALVGIRRLDPSRFKAIIQHRHGPQEPVHSMGGCIVETRPFAKIVKEIDSGSYDPWLQRPRKPAISSR